MLGPLPAVLQRSDSRARLRDAGLLLLLAGWLLYTRLYWSLQAVHATLPPCPFLMVTGQPCPFCGGTRSFAHMWGGDLSGAARLYPLGPVLFAGTLAAGAGLFASVLGNRTLRWPASPWLDRRLQVAVGALFGFSWLLKLTLLPN